MRISIYIPDKSQSRISFSIPRHRLPQPIGFPIAERRSRLSGSIDVPSVSYLRLFYQSLLSLLLYILRSEFARGLRAVKLRDINARATYTYRVRMLGSCVPQEGATRGAQKKRAIPLCSSSFSSASEALNKESLCRYSRTPAPPARNSWLLRGVRHRSSSSSIGFFPSSRTRDFLSDRCLCATA